MWVCASCGAPVDDRLSQCHRCGESVRSGAPLAAPGPSQPPADGEAPIERISPDVSASFALQVEARVCSTLAAWVWILAVFAFFPVLGILPAALLAGCSVVLIRRRRSLRWDRRVGVAGLIISLAAFAVLGLWLAVRVMSSPFDAPEFRIGPVGAPSWQVTAIQLVVLVVSIVLHECAHAVSAYWSGDGTAARRGRIRLNPLAHIDLFGSIILPAILIMTPGDFVLGWAKPVPIDRRQFRSPRLGLLAVTLAGVSVNLLLALASVAGLLAVGSALRLTCPEATTEGFSSILHEAKFHGASGAPVWEFVTTVFKQGLLINLVLFAFNVLPIPPLDGYGVLESLAPRPLGAIVAGLRPIGSILLLVLIFSGVLIYVLLPAFGAAAILNWAAGAMTGWG